MTAPLAQQKQAANFDLLQNVAINAKTDRLAATADAPPDDQPRQPDMLYAPLPQNQGLNQTGLVICDAALPSVIPQAAFGPANALLHIMSGLCRNHRPCPAELEARQHPSRTMGRRSPSLDLGRDGLDLEQKLAPYQAGAGEQHRCRSRVAQEAGPDLDVIRDVPLVQQVVGYFDQIVDRHAR